MFGKRLINTQQGGGCTTDTLQILGDTSCVATYRLNGDATDLSGNYNGTATSVTYVAGQFGDAGSFNGSSSILETGYSVNFSNTAWTISFWMKSNIADNRYVLGTGNANGVAISARGVASTTGYGTKAMYLINGGNTQIGYTIGEWKHFVYTFSGSGTSKGYGNGVLEDTKSSIVLNTGDPIILGKYGLANCCYFDGAIDQLRIFNKEVNSTEVTTLYNEVAC